MTFAVPPSHPEPEQLSYVGSWLLPKTEVAGSKIERVLKSSDGGLGSPIWGTLGRSARAAVAHEVVTALRLVINHRIVDVLVDGWRQHRLLVDAARTTVVTGQQRLVTLRDFTVTFVHEPKVDVFANEVRLLTLDAQVRLEVLITDMVAVIRAGRLMELRAGTAALVGTAGLEGQEIVRRSKQLRLDLLIQLGVGVDLTGASFQGSALSA